MNLYKKFARNEARSIVTGAPLILGAENGKQSVIYVARAHHSYKEYGNYVDELKRKHQKELDSLRENDKNGYADLETDIVLEAIATHCVKSVENVTGEDGMPFVVTAANVRKLFKDLPELADKVLMFAVDASNYVGTFDEESSIKN